MVHSRNSNTSCTQETPFPPPVSKPLSSSSSSCALLSSYSYISTLERQYAPGIGNRIFLFVQANEGCCVKGGVEGLLNSASSLNGVNDESIRSNGHLDPFLTLREEEVMSNASLANVNESQKENASATNDQVCIQSKSDVVDDTCTTDETATDSGDTSSTVQTKPTATRPPRSSFGRFFKSVGRSIDRGMHKLAIRADKGRTPDLLTVALYLVKGATTNSENPDTKDVISEETLLCATESQPLPRNDANDDGVLFHLPLIVLGTLADVDQLVLRLWIRSGWLQSTTSSNFFLGLSTTTVGQLRHAMTRKNELNVENSIMLRPTIMNFRLASPLSTFSDSNESATLSLCVTPDLKYAWNNDTTEKSRNWSLTDPCFFLNPLDHPSLNVSRHHYPTIDQSFAFSFRNKSLLLLTQRITESNVVLPIATAIAQLAANSCRISLAHAESTANIILAQRHDAAMGNYADCQLELGYVQLKAHNTSADDGGDASPVLNATIINLKEPYVAVSWQRPDSIFEVELMPFSCLPIGPGEAGFIAAHSTRFFPKPCINVLPFLLKQLDGKLPPCGFLLGTLRVRLRMMTSEEAVTTLPKKSPRKQRRKTLWSNDPDDSFAENDPNVPPPIASSSSTFSSADVTNAAAQKDESDWECFIALEEILLRRRGMDPVKDYLLVDTKSGREMAVVTLSLTICMNQGPEVPVKPTSTNDGLVSLVGLAPLGCFTPFLDFDVEYAFENNDSMIERLRKLSTLGGFVPHAYMEQHTNEIREHDTEIMNARAVLYKTALQNIITAENDETFNDDDGNNEMNINTVLPYQEKVPRSFRPSTSHSSSILSGLPLNQHTQLLSFCVVDPAVDDDDQDCLNDDLFVTTGGGACDLSKGFGNIFNMTAYLSRYPIDDDEDARKHRSALMELTCPLGVVCGGLQRLESKRLELTNYVVGLQEHLEAAVDVYLNNVRSQSQVVNVNYAPTAQFDVQGMRWKVFEALQALHHVTWTCALRRVPVFSQILCQAVSAYLTALSDKDLLMNKSACPELWVRFGFLVSFESLLGTSGKELGIMEDTFIGSQMLQMVRVVLVSCETYINDAERFPVPYSNHLKWISVETNGQNESREFTILIGLDSSYLKDCVPTILQNNTPVQFVPVFFVADLYCRPANLNNTSKETLQSLRLSCDEDDDTDVVVKWDETIAMHLNEEGFKKLNAYAHQIQFIDDIARSPDEVHPLLLHLKQQLENSTPFMTHESIVQVSAIVRELSGGSIVCCVNGKDQTALHVTFLQASLFDAFSARYAAPSTPPPPPPLELSENDVVIIDYGDTMPAINKTEAIDKSNDEGSEFNSSLIRMLRVYGTSLPLCEKNLGQAVYSFTPRQIKALLPHLQPPPETVARRGLFARKSSTR